MQSEPSPSPALSGNPPPIGGKYLTFRLGNESYGIAVLKVREIIRMLDITHVPQMPEYVKGVVNLRGRVVPIIDLRLKFQLAHAEFGERTCIVVVDVKLASGSNAPMGLIVDAVEEVTGIATSEIESTPDFGLRLSTDYILGMAKVKGSVKTLLDIDRVVASKTLESIVEKISGR